MYEIVVIGNPLYNSISTPEFHTDGRILTGPAMNISQVITRLEIQEIVAVGAIGHDFKDKFVEDVDHLGIPEYYVVETESTGGFHISCDDGGAPTMKLLSQARPLRIRDIPEEFLNAENIVVAPSYREIDSEIIEWLSDSSDATIILDAQGMGYIAQDDGFVSVNPRQDMIHHALSYANVVKMERSLWRIITGESDPLLAAEHIVEDGADIGITMLSSMGAVIYDGNEFYIVPLDREVRRNVLGASDAFLGAFVVGMVQQRNMLDTSALASSAASFVLETSCAEFKISSHELLRKQQSILDRIVIK